MAQLLACPVGELFSEEFLHSGKAFGCSCRAAAQFTTSYKDMCAGALAPDCVVVGQAMDAFKATMGARCGDALKGMAKLLRDSSAPKTLVDNPIILKAVALQTQLFGHPG